MGEVGVNESGRQDDTWPKGLSSPVYFSIVARGNISAERLRGIIAHRGVPCKATS